MTPGTIDDTARRVLRARWLEQRCFELLGGWVTSTPEPEVKLALARQSHHHAWHAELFDRVVPTANGLDVDHHADPGPGWVALLVQVAALSATPDRLATAYDVLLPAKVAEYEEWLEVADPIRDAPLRRWLGFVVADEQADLAEGRTLLAQFPAAAAAPSRAAVLDALGSAGRLLG